MKKDPLHTPRFQSESDEADWWASAAGRAFAMRKSAEARASGNKPAGSRLVASLNKKYSSPDCNPPA
jgi:hypothetical protein